MVTRRVLRVVKFMLVALVGWWVLGVFGRGGVRWMEAFVELGKRVVLRWFWGPGGLLYAFFGVSDGSYSDVRL